MGAECRAATCLATQETGCGTAAVHTRHPMPVTVTHMFNSCPLTIVFAFELHAHGSVTYAVNRAGPTGPCARTALPWLQYGTTNCPYTHTSIPTCLSRLVPPMLCPV